MVVWSEERHQMKAMTQNMNVTVREGSALCRWMVPSPASVVRGESSRVQSLDSSTVADGFVAI